MTTDDAYFLIESNRAMFSRESARISGYDDLSAIEKKDSIERLHRTAMAWHREHVERYREAQRSEAGDAPKSLNDLIRAGGDDLGPRLRADEMLLLAAPQLPRS